MPGLRQGVTWAALAPSLANPPMRERSPQPDFCAPWGARLEDPGSRIGRVPSKKELPCLPPLVALQGLWSSGSYPSNMSEHCALDELATKGWAVIEGVDFAELLDLCEGLGGQRKVKRLLARRESEADGPSLTASFGLGRFPPHTDGASEVAAPRYVALWSPAEHETATLLYDGENPSLDRPLFSRAWLSGAGRRRFYVVPRRVTCGQVRWRLNLDCMRPVDARDAIAIEEDLAHLEQLPSTRIVWRPKRALVFDNARILHGREELAANDCERELMRISVVG